MSKEACCIILDVGLAMNKPMPQAASQLAQQGNDTSQRDAAAAATQKSGLDTAKEALRLMIQQKLLFAPKQDEMALITFGSRVTNNKLHTQILQQMRGDQQNDAMHDADDELQCSQYEHINVLRELKRPDLSLLKLIDSIQCDNSSSCKQGDWVDALLVAMEMISSRVKKLKFTKRIYLVTNGAMHIIDDAQALQQICDGCVTEKFRINVIGIGCQDTNDENENEQMMQHRQQQQQQQHRSQHDDALLDDSSSGLDRKSASIALPAPTASEPLHSHSSHSNSNAIARASTERLSSQSQPIVKSDSAALAAFESQRTPTQISNERLLRSVCDRVQGAFRSVNTALEFYSELRGRSINQVTKYRGPLTIGTIQIPVYSYGKTAIQSLPTLKKRMKQLEPAVLGDDGDEIAAAEEAAASKVSLERHYFARDGADPTAAALGQQEIPPEQRMRAFRYGKEFVPVSDAEFDNLKYSADKCLVVLGFIEECKVQRYQFMSHVDCIVSEPDNHEAAQALSAFIHALFELEKCCIVRYVKRKNDRPLLGVLTVHVSSVYEALYFNQLPFAEDVRDFSFAGLETKPENIPTKNQISACEKLIDTMNLMQPIKQSENAHAIKVDPYETEELLQPDKTYNPVLQHFYQSVTQRALDPAAPIQPLNPIIADYLQPDKRLLESARPALDEIRRQFPLQRVVVDAERQKRVLHWRNAYAAQAMGQLNASADADVAQVGKAQDGAMQGDENQASEDAFRMSALVQQRVSQINSVHPVADFEAMLARRDDTSIFTRAFAQMCEMIHTLLRDSYATSGFEKALDCMRSLRSACVKFEETLIYNEMLSKLHSFLVQIGKTPFWNKLSDAKLCPISNDEVSDSTYSPSEAEQFFVKNAGVPEMSISIQAEEPPQGDDIFNEME